MLTDIEISNQTIPFKINKIAKQLNLKQEDLEPYGHYKAKLSRTVVKKLTEDKNSKGNLILFYEI